MAVFVRAKQVTDPLDEKVKARLVGGEHYHLSFATSGSNDSDDGSLCLSELIHDFLDESSGAESTDSEFDSERVDSETDNSDAIDEIHKVMAADRADAYRMLLRAHVSNAVTIVSRLRSNKSVVRQNVVAFLRDLGHNVATCKTKWNSSGGLTAGSYEFIDAIQPSSGSSPQIRYLVDLDFAAEFEIARPTVQYSRLLQTLPKVFVGKAEELKTIVKVMCDAAKRSLRSTGLSLPPWRKNRYMQKKWLGPYMRTVNQIPEKSLSSAIPPVAAAKCRLVGFNDVASNVNVNGHAFVRTR